MADHHSTIAELPVPIHLPSSSPRGSTIGEIPIFSSPNPTVIELPAHAPRPGFSSHSSTATPSPSPLPTNRNVHPSSHYYENQPNSPPIPVNPDDPTTAIPTTEIHNGSTISSNYYYENQLNSSPIPVNPDDFTTAIHNGPKISSNYYYENQPNSSPIPVNPNDPSTASSHHYEGRPDSSQVPLHKGDPITEIHMNELPAVAPKGKKDRQDDSYDAPERVPSRASSHYHAVVPLQQLNRGPAPVDCPSCRKRTMTKTNENIGNFTHIWAALACLTLCSGCVPYFIKSTKDVEHSCENCGVVLAVWRRRAGGVDVVVPQYPGK